MRRDPSKRRKLLALVAFLLSRACEAIPDFRLSRSEIAHQSQTTDAAASVSAKIDNQPGGVLQVCECSIEHFCEINADRSWKHRHFQPTDSVGQLRAENGFGNNHGMTLRARRWHMKGAHYPLAVRFLNGVLRVITNRKNWRVGRMQLPISDLKEDVTRPQASGMRRAALVNVLEHPTLSTIDIAAHERGADSMSGRNVVALRVPKTSVAGLQFVQEFLHSPLKLLVAFTLEDAVSSFRNQRGPIRTIHSGIEMSLRHHVSHARVDLAASATIEGHS